MFVYLDQIFIILKLQSYLEYFLIYVCCYMCVESIFVTCLETCMESMFVDILRLTNCEIKRSFRCDADAVVAASPSQLKQRLISQFVSRRISNAASTATNTQFSVRESRQRKKNSNNNVKAFGLHHSSKQLLCY